MKELKLFVLVLVILLVPNSVSAVKFLDAGMRFGELSSNPGQYNDRSRFDFSISKRSTLQFNIEFDVYQPFIDLYVHEKGIFDDGFYDFESNQLPRISIDNQSLLDFAIEDIETKTYETSLDPGDYWVQINRFLPEVGGAAYVNLSLESKEPGPSPFLFQRFIPYILVITGIGAFLLILKIQSLHSEIKN